MLGRDREGTVQAGLLSLLGRISNSRPTHQPHRTWGTKIESQCRVATVGFCSQMIIKKKKPARVGQKGAGVCIIAINSPGVPIKHRGDFTA